MKTWPECLGQIRAHLPAYRKRQVWGFQAQRLPAGCVHHVPNGNEATHFVALREEWPGKWVVLDPSRPWPQAMSALDGYNWALYAVCERGPDGMASPLPLPQVVARLPAPPGFSSASAAFCAVVNQV